MAAPLARQLIVGLSGSKPTPHERVWLAGYAPAGVILFSRNCIDGNQLRDTCAELHDLVPGLEIMADHEGGPVSQLSAALGRPPCAWSLGRLDDVPLTARVHAETARRLRAAGIDRVLAPVADVLTAPRNPVIGSRAFGAETALVTRHVVAAVTGLVDGGVRVCLKHWPGHGGSDSDPHLVAAEAGGRDCAEPFEAGLNAGADAVMVGHIATGAEGTPATLDADFLAASRRRLAAGGSAPAWYADDVTMGALRPAMRAGGIPLPDDQSEGMVEPSRLSEPWFSALVDAGCDRLLVRGLPLTAFPLPGTDVADTGGRAGDQEAGVAADGRAYDEVRDRGWAPAGHGFADRAADLLWWDLTVGDRWQVAGGERGSSRALLTPILADHFARVLDWDTGGVVERPVARLLVSSHRPLPPLDRRDPRLAASGICLALGHPSLVADLTSYLAGGWRVGHLPDIAPEDLFRLERGPAGPQNKI